MTKATEALPIDSVLPEIVEKLRGAGSLVLKAEPGAGKTTRVAPAILDAKLAGTGQLVLLQPRRIAARSAASRMSEERGTKLGDDIGYAVRFESKFSKNTKILVCTEGVFLRRLQEDPLLEGVSVVVFDEFHERSIDGDLALAMVRQVKEQVRDDLKIVVMSATLDSAPIARYLGDCPTVESPGRRFPVEIEYAKFTPNLSISELAADAIVELLGNSENKQTDHHDAGASILSEVGNNTNPDPKAETSAGAKSVSMTNSGEHILVFLPGVGAIRRTQELLENSPTVTSSNALVMPLFGDMALEEQQRVLHPTAQRKIILSTNVAETSLTIDGVTAVIDTGVARVNRFHPQLGLNKLELERISKASAEQRAGRAGRTAAGRCLRLWTEREQYSMPDFETPEIARVELSQTILQIIAWGESNVEAFPFFEMPPPAALERALVLLELLGALEDGKITAIGKAMAALPLQPRLARLMLESQNLGIAARGALCAALLSERDPFRRPSEPRKAVHRSDSDTVDRVTALETFADNGARDSYVGSLIPSAAKQVLRAASQLARLVRDRKDCTPESVNVDEALMRAILAAFPDRLCKRRTAGDARARMVGGRGVRLAEESAVTEDELFVAVELTETGRSESLVRQASSVHRTWLPASHFKATVDVAYDPARQKVVAFKRTKFADLILDEMPTKMPADAVPSAALAEGILANLDLNSLIDEEAQKFLTRIEFLREYRPELDLPTFGEQAWRELLPEWCFGNSAVTDLTAQGLIGVMQSRLTREQVKAIEDEAPTRFDLPSGRTAKIEYEAGKPPILAVRIQELFGLAETPRIAGGRTSVLLHLLAPNYRVQQITPDLASFWKNTYPTVKKELKQRYPKHAWPDNPLVAPPPQPKRT